MDKVTFLKELEFLLQDISDEEREDALSFYENYFDEAGKDNEKKIIEELGEPTIVAAKIKDSLNGKFEENIHSSNQGFENENYQKSYEIGDMNNKSEKNDFFENLKIKWDELHKKDRNLLVILLILACIPFTFSLMTGIANVGFGVIFGICACLFGFWLASFLGYVVSIGFFVWGIYSLFYTVGWGLILIGIGFICLGVSKGLGHIACAISSGIKSIWNKLFHKESQHV